MKAFRTSPKPSVTSSFKILLGVGLFSLVTLSAGAAGAEGLTCSGLWAGVDSIMGASAQLNPAADGTPTSMKLAVNNAEFRGSMMASSGGTYNFSVRRVGTELVLAGTLRFLDSVADPAKTGFVLHTADGRIEAILTCDHTK
jgi:hypothetical protein